MNGFCLECHLILKKCWFEVGQSEFKHPVLTLSFTVKQLFIVFSNSQWTPKIVEGPRILVSHHLEVAEGLTDILPSNNNVAATLFYDRLFMAWRSAPTHFASAQYVT